jgi:hypothetical protein
MPQYEFKNKETGEVIDVILRLSEYDQWKSDHPEYERHHSPSSAPKLVSETRDAYAVAGKDWSDKLKEIKATSGKDNTINV